jgi:hypothetical protein
MTRAVIGPDKDRRAVPQVQAKDLFHNCLPVLYMLFFLRKPGRKAPLAAVGAGILATASEISIETEKTAELKGEHSQCSEEQSLKQREYRGKEGNVQHHTRKYQEQHKGGQGRSGCDARPRGRARTSSS